MRYAFAFQSFGRNVSKSIARTHRLVARVDGPVRRNFGQRRRSRTRARCGCRRVAPRPDRCRSRAASRRARRACRLASTSAIMPLALVVVRGSWSADFGALPPAQCATVHFALGGRPRWMIAAASRSGLPSVFAIDSITLNCPAPVGRSNARNDFGVAGSQIAISPACDRRERQQAHVDALRPELRRSAAGDRCPSARRARRAWAGGGGGGGSGMLGFVGRAGFFATVTGSFCCLRAGAIFVAVASSSVSPPFRTYRKSL